MSVGWRCTDTESSCNCRMSDRFEQPVVNRLREEATAAGDPFNKQSDHPDDAAVPNANHHQLTIGSRLSDCDKRNPFIYIMWQNSVQVTDTNTCHHEQRHTPPPFVFRPTLSTNAFICHSIVSHIYNIGKSMY